MTSRLDRCTSLFRLLAGTGQQAAVLRVGLPLALSLSFWLFFTGVETCCGKAKGGDGAEVEELGQVAVDPVSVAEEWGVEIEGIRLSAGGYMLDFRYRVVHQDKAAPLFQRNIKPYLIHHASGAKLLMAGSPKTGPLRTSDPPKKGRTYCIIFANPGRRVKAGERVTLIIGEFQTGKIVVMSSEGGSG